MQDQIPMTWVDNVSTLDDDTLNTEIRNAYNLLLAPPMCSVHSSSPVSIAAGTYMTTWTALSWDSPAVFDTEDPSTPMFSSSNATRVTIQTPGWYECIATARENGLPAANVWTGAFRVNGSTYYAGSTVGRSTTILDLSLSNIISLNTGDYVEFVMTHDNTSALTMAVNGFVPSMVVCRRRGR